MENFPMTRIISCVATSCVNHGGDDIGCIMKVVEIDDRGKCLSCRLESFEEESLQCHYEPPRRGDNNQPLPYACVHEEECIANGLRQTSKCRIK